MRISDWSSDVCSSDLVAHAGALRRTRPCLAPGHVVAPVEPDYVDILDEEEVGGNLRYAAAGEAHGDDAALGRDTAQRPVEDVAPDRVEDHVGADRKSTRLNSSH